jgi:uncharacterized protein YqeY
MTLTDQITEDMKTAMRAKDSVRLGTIRLLLAACKQREVDERVVLDDAAVIAILDKLIKQRKDEVAAEVKTIVDALATELGRKPGPGEMGKVMGAVKAQLAGKAEMSQVSSAVKAALS